MTKVLVTGASGFIAKHIIRELLEQGYDVRGSVRSERRADEVRALFPDASIEFVTLDLMRDDGWDDALVGVDVLLHTASPFPTEQPKDRDELIRPAVDGTLRALRAAQAAGVRRVILTSSCASIYKDSTKPPMERSSEEHWTDPEASFVTPYEASKTLAERAAWDFVVEHPEFELTAINPGGVFGPPMDEHYGTSLEYVERFLAASDPMWPNMNLPAVDVRDVARMHVAAIDNEKAVGERFAANAGAITMVGAAQLLADAYPDRKIKTRQAPDWLIRGMALFVPMMRQVTANLGRNSDVDGSKAERVLSFTYIPSEQALLDSAASIVANESTG